ncbi:MAG: restriction endonuclease subunit S [Bacteroidaceae bacterium]|nr:restriction endonuclease subunit S [Bacteroidaceae bacterium]
MQRYNEYKDSGVKWLGEIPSHWKMLALKHILRYKKDIVGSKFRLYDLLSLTLKGVIKRDMENPEGKFPASFVTYQKVQQNDFIFCNFDNEETPRAVGISPYDGMITGAYDVFNRKNSKLTDRFLTYYFLYIDDAKRLKPYYKGLRKTVPFDSFMAYKIPVPTLDEQEAIATYLDEATSKIDAAIAQQQRMIELLNERKQIIINNAVTKGLDPNVKMKDSGVEWIGEIPEHWKVRKLKYCSKTNSGSTPKTILGKENPLSNIKWVRTTDLANSKVYDTTECLSLTEIKSASCPLLPKDTVLISMYGGMGSFGKLGILGVEATINQAICSINCYQNIFPQYVFYYLQSIHPIWMKFAASTRKDPNLNQDTIKNIFIVLPTLKEQVEIADFIDKKIDEIKETLDCVTNQITLLQERKQIIINDVVTGKVKVV